MRVGSRGLSACAAIVVALWSAAAADRLSADGPAPVLPPGLAQCQLKGSLVCPPLMAPGRGVLVACDDRTVSLLDFEARVVWRRELDRSIRGPISLGANGSLLLPLSNRYLACLDMAGKVLWQRQMAGQGDPFLAVSPDGRLFRLFPDGKAEVSNPDGSLLFAVQVPGPIARPPRVGGRGLVLPGGSEWRLLDWSGGLRAIDPPLESPGPPPLQFKAEPGGKGYRMRLAAAEGTLDFEANGSVGHWLADHSDGVTLAWGDSLWRCFIFRAVLPGASPPPSAALGADGDGGLEALQLERHYLAAFLADEGAAGPDQAIDHIRSALRNGRLPGRMSLYEDVLLDLAFARRGRDWRSTLEQRVAAVRLLAAFPSLPQWDRMRAAAADEADPGMAAALVDYAAALGVDPEGAVGLGLAEAARRWRLHFDLRRLSPGLAALARRMGPDWWRRYGGEFAGGSSAPPAF